MRMSNLVIQLEDGIKIRHCDCVGGYYGDVCTIDNCSPDPCNGKGNCEVVDNDDGYECDCHDGHYVRGPSCLAYIIKLGVLVPTDPEVPYLLY